jgi:nicotinamide-nucleotide amidase
MKAEIIAVGSELLTPDRTDTNSLFLTGQLNRLGIVVTRKTVVGDRNDDVKDAFREALGRVELVIASGGLGPTQDDLTREAVAELLGRKLVRNDAVMKHIEERFRRLGRTMAEVNRRQAMVPEGAEVLENTHGTAPGLWLEERGRVVVLLPGVPRELMALFSEQVAPRLGRFAGATRLFYRELRTAGMTESEVEQRIAPIYTAYAGVETTILASLGEIQIHLRAWSEDAAATERMLQEMVERITLALGEGLFTTNGETLEEVVARDLTMNQASVATAESCTGGLLAQRLTRTPGSSVYFLGGVVCYSNNLKTGWADVPASVLESKGAVSAEVARALAEGIRRRTGATLGIGITGIAGPGGGTPEKPVGLVHIALAAAGGCSERVTRFPGAREQIRWFASQMALDMIRQFFLHGGVLHSGVPHGGQAAERRDAIKAAGRSKSANRRDVDSGGR